jgi:hypothetical protein
MKIQWVAVLSVALSLGACADRKSALGPPAGYRTLECTYEQVHTVNRPDYHRLNRYPDFDEVWNTGGFYSQERCGTRYSRQVPYW